MRCRGGGWLCPLSRAAADDLLGIIGFPSVSDGPDLPDRPRLKDGHKLATRSAGTEQHLVPGANESAANEYADIQSANGTGANGTCLLL